MLLKIKVCLSGKKTYNIGDITDDFDDDSAKRLIEKGYAEEVKSENKTNNTTNKKANKSK